MKVKKRNLLILRLVFWFATVLLFFIAIVQFESVWFAFKLSVSIILPLFVPVHINEYLFEKYFLKRKKLKYILFGGINLAVFGYLMKLLQKYIEPDGNAEAHMSILFFMFLYLGIKYMVKGTQQQFRIKELEAKQTLAELNLLKSQVKPHFLFNSLNSIYSLILKESKDSGNAVLILSDLMRYILESSNKKMVLLKEELEFIENYINLEKLRLGKNTTIVYSFNGSSDNLYIAPMILIPFVENVFKHGVAAIDENKLLLEIKINNNELYFRTENSLVAGSNKLEDTKVKTGIKNVKKRLSLLYPNEYSLDIKSKESTFQVQLIIKLKF